MFNKHDISRDTCQLFGEQAKQGYDWWWHSFTAHNAQTGEQKAFFIEFFLCNPAARTERPVFGQLKSNKKKKIKPSYLMVKVGTWGKDAAQVHKFWGWRKAEVAFGEPFSISAGECYLSETGTRGSIKVTQEEVDMHKEWMCQAGEMSWSLTIDKQVAFNVGYGASKPMRKAQLFEMFWHAEGMKTAYKGEVIWNGTRYIVSPENCYGYADKNWGKNFTSPWVWLSSNNLKSEITGKKLTNSVFDIGGGCPKIGNIALKRKLLSAFWYEGREFEFNFSKFWTFCRTKFDCRETDRLIIWNVEQRTLTKKMVTNVTCRKKDMLLVNYESPDGMKRHDRLWNGGTGRGTVELYRFGKLVDRIHADNVGCEYGEYGSQRRPRKNKKKKRKNYSSEKTEGGNARQL